MHFKILVVFAFTLQQIFVVYFYLKFLNRYNYIYISKAGKNYIWFHKHFRVKIHNINIFYIITFFFKIVINLHYIYITTNMQVKIGGVTEESSSHEGGGREIVES